MASSRGRDMAIASDGPRGPRMRVNGGIISLAKVSNVPIVPLTFSASPLHVFSSWDRFSLPFPFGRGWSNDKFYAMATTPGGSFPIIGMSSAWTPGTNGLVSGEAIHAVIEDVAHGLYSDLQLAAHHLDYQQPVGDVRDEAARRELGDRRDVRGAAVERHDEIVFRLP